MKLLPLLGISSSYAFSKTEEQLVATDDAGKCLVCEYVNVAASEADAIAALEGSAAVPCVVPETDVRI